MPENAGETTVLWSVRRPPPIVWRIWLWVVALAIGALCGAFAIMLSSQPSWWMAVAVGLCFTVAVILLGGGGAHARLLADGTLIYGNHHKDAWRLPITTVQDWQWIYAPPLVGVGMRIDPAAIVFLHKRGLHYRMMERHQTAFGVNVIAEWLWPDDLDALRSQLARLGAQTTDDTPGAGVPA